LVTFYKKKSGRFRKMASKTVTLSSTGAYSATFKRLRGSCKLTAVFLGTSQYAKSTRTITFRC
jgi:hypothetical protein